MRRLILSLWILIVLGDDPEKPDECRTGDFCANQPELKIEFGDDSNSKSITGLMDGCCRITMEGDVTQTKCWLCSQCNSVDLPFAKTTECIPGIRKQSSSGSAGGPITCTKDTADECKKMGTIDNWIAIDGQRIDYKGIKTTGCCVLTNADGSSIGICLDGCDCTMEAFKAKTGATPNKIEWFGDPCSNGSSSSGSNAGGGSSTSGSDRPEAEGFSLFIQLASSVVIFLAMKNRETVYGARSLLGL